MYCINSSCVNAPIVRGGTLPRTTPATRGTTSRTKTPSRTTQLTRGTTSREGTLYRTIQVTRITTSKESTLHKTTRSTRGTRGRITFLSSIKQTTSPTGCYGSKCFVSVTPCVCNGRGVCDDRKVCKCDHGWSPPYCVEKSSRRPMFSNNIAAVCSKFRCKNQYCLNLWYKTKLSVTIYQRNCSSFTYLVQL